ncbi:MAG: hypothetical protein ACREO3_04165, partial [Arenimonas sp.]
DLYGGRVPPAPEGGGFTLMAGCDGNWTSEGGIGRVPGETAVVRQCLQDFKSREDWLMRSPGHSP